MIEKEIENIEKICSMTPEEKAKEIFDKFKAMDFHDLTNHFYCAKECALITVNEVISTYKSDWWVKVKKRIESYESDNPFGDVI